MNQMDYRDVVLPEGAQCHGRYDRIDDCELDGHPGRDLFKKSREEFGRPLLRIQRPNRQIASGEEFVAQSPLPQNDNDNVIFLPQGAGQVEGKNWRAGSRALMRDQERCFPFFCPGATDPP